MSYVVASFDPGTRALGVGWIRFDPSALTNLPRVDALVGSLDERIAALERLVDTYRAIIDKAVQVWADVWDISGEDIDDAARNLKTRLQKFDLERGPFTEVHYEFQMNQNDKSRMITSFLRYHYAGTCPVHKIPGTYKNMIAFTPALDHRLYLARFESQYRANKEHSADSFRYLARVWGVRIDHIPHAVHKDAGDAVMQAWYRLRERNVPRARERAPAKRARRRIAAGDLDIS